MDELKLLAESLPAHRPASPEVVAKARERLDSARSRPARKDRSSRFGRGAGWAVGALATAAVIALVAVLVSNLTPAPAPVAAPSRANDALHRLADRVARLPDDRGAYWRNPLVVRELTRVKAGGRTFTVESSSRSDLWQPRDVGDVVQTESRQEYVRPATPADELAWRQAGSPDRVDRVCARGARPANCRQVRIRTEPSSCVYTREVVPDGVLGDQRMGKITVAELEGLPGDTARLRQWLRERHARTPDGPFEEYLARAFALLDLPLRPATRAALLHLLADAPLTRTLGDATDPLGRRGLAVTFLKSDGFTGDFGADSEVPERYATMLDPRTGTMLAATVSAGEATEGLTKGSVMLYIAWPPEAGWTGERPERPGSCKLARNQPRP